MEEQKKKTSINEFFEISVWVTKTIFSIHPVYATCDIIFTLLGNVRTIVYSFIFAKALDYIIKLGASGNATLSDVYPILIFLILYNLVFQALSYFERYFGSVLEFKSDVTFQQILYKKINSLGIQTLEDPNFNNQVFRARGSIGSVLNFYGQIVELVGTIINAIISITVALKFSPIVVLIICIVMIPRYLKDKSYRKSLWKFNLTNTENRRLASINANDLSNTSQLQEIFINNSYNYLDKKFTNFFDWYVKAWTNLRKKGLIWLYSLGSVGDISLYLGYLQIFKNFFAGNVSVGNVYFQITMLSNVQDYLFDTLSSINNLFEFSIKVKDVYGVFQTKPGFGDGEKTLPEMKGGPTIEFQNVKFKYPHTEKYVINGIDLKIKAGEKVAIVGQNGAGKTTLVRLLSRMYKLTEGEILIDGEDIKELKADSLHNNMGVLFQEFNTYPQLTVRENIYLGNSNKPIDEEKIKEAAKNADALNFIEALPNKFDQLLNEKFKNGIKLSTGQWQKIAIARFFYRNAHLVIFDEPTASIDAESEYTIFNRIYSFFKDKTVIIISHRFSTVRNADRILVLKDGRFIEDGTHKELINKKDGEYAKAFKLQAEGYILDQVETIA